MPLDHPSTHSWSYLCRWKLTASPTALLCDRHGRADGSLFKKPYRHLTRQADATVRRGKGWNVPLMHCITASEEHGIWHPGAIKMGPFGRESFRESTFDLT